jgi:SDR family mycofactocin-dependent oxidoreductase
VDRPVRAGDPGVRALQRLSYRFAVGADRDGTDPRRVPVRCWTFPGNTADTAIIHTLKADLGGWNLRRLVWVADRVFAGSSFISGAARGQGRSHAVLLASEGADIIAVDLLEQVSSVPYDLSTQADLDETVRLVEATGRRIVALKADVRDHAAMTAAFKTGVGKLGSVDIVLANAGIFSAGMTADLTAETWRDMIDINLTGAFNTVQPSISYLLDQGTGGSIVITSSIAGLHGTPGCSHYAAAKHGLVGLMRSLSNELGPHGIRVNSVHPTNVATPMIMNEALYKIFVPNEESPTLEQFTEASSSTHMLPIPWADVSDISNAVLFLVSDDARYITGETLRVDGGAVTRVI